MQRPRVVIIGAGFGGISAARALRHAEADVLVIDRHNYHLFQPLLYQVASGLLDPAEIAHPVRTILRAQRNTDVRMTTVSGVDLERGTLQTDGGEVGYDFLIAAAGAVTSHFGHEDIAVHSLGLKGLNDALALRATVLRCFERAAECDDDARRRLLTFVIAGGGPTGVEFAGALSELVTHLLPRDFPRTDFSVVRLVLVEGTGHVLGSFHHRLGGRAARVLRRRGVEIVLGRTVVAASGTGVTLDDGTAIPAATLVWTAGVSASPLGAQLTAATGRGGRVPVRATLQLPGHDEVQVIGDLAELEVAGTPLPMLAPVAIQQGEHAARNVLSMLHGGPAAPFRYRDKGTMATVGRNVAVVQLGRIRVAGFIGWLMWLFVHLMYIVTFRSKAVVLINWAWNYVFNDRPVRLITEVSPDPTSSSPRRH